MTAVIWKKQKVSYHTPPTVADSVAAALLRSYAQRAPARAQYDLFLPADLAATAPPAEFRFYGASNFTIRPDDYTALPTFTEVNRELMPGVRLRQGKRGYDPDVFDISLRTFLNGEPSVFLDGVLVHYLPYIVAFANAAALATGGVAQPRPVPTHVG